MNITLLLIIFIFILAIVHGFKKGFTKEISALISWAVTLFVMSLIIMLYSSFRSSEGKNIIFTIIFLIATSVIYALIRFVFKPAKSIAKLPLFHFFDQLLGIVIGAAEGLVIVWLIYILNESGVLGNLGEIIREDTVRSQILSFIYEYNYLIRIAAGF